MAWLEPDFIDTFLGYPGSGAVSLNKWTSGGGTTNVTIAEDGLQGITSGGTLLKTLPSAPPGRIIGARWAGSFSNGESSIISSRFLDTSNAGSLTYLELTGQIRLRLPEGTIIDSSSVVVANNQLHNTELMILFDGAKCWYAVVHDAAFVPELVGNVNYVGTPGIALLGCGFGGMNGVTAPVGGLSWVATKPYSGAGGVAGINDFFLNSRRFYKQPNADGWYPGTAIRGHAVGGINWIPNAGTAFFSRLNEAQADSDVTRVSNTTDPGGAPGTADRMSYELTDSPANLNQIKGVQRCILGRAASGTGTVRPFYRIEGDPTPGADTMGTSYAPGSSWGFQLIAGHNGLAVDPISTNPWTKSLLDRLELGDELVDLV